MKETKTGHKTGLWTFFSATFIKLDILLYTLFFYKNIFYKNIKAEIRKILRIFQE